MAKVNDYVPVSTLRSDGNYGGKRLYSFKTQADANMYCILAINLPEATKMSDAIASNLGEVVSTVCALQPVYIKTGLGTPAP